VRVGILGNRAFVSRFEGSAECSASVVGQPAVTARFNGFEARKNVFDDACGVSP